MAQSITLTSGSVFNGNPITFDVVPSVKKDASMHRIIIEVECGMSGGNYEVIKMSSPVIKEGVPQSIDISSALRTFRDSYEYSPKPTTYPIVKFNVKAYDEYMVNGVVDKTAAIYFPQNPSLLPEDQKDEAYLRTIFGAFSDLDRITSATPSKGVIRLSRKPTSMPEIVCCHSSFVYAQPYNEEQILPTSVSLVPPTSKAVNILREGPQYIGDHLVFGLPGSEYSKRQQFRFINSFGVLESVNVPKVAQKKLAVTSNDYAITRPETFNKFSHGIVRKQNDRESWSFSTDPLDEAWYQWYLHEFMMAEHVWTLILPPSGIESEGVWLRCSIVPEDDTTIYDITKPDAFTVNFTARLDINGSPLL